MSNQTTGGMDIRLHPLVVMGVADHYTRSVTQLKRNKVVGALLGVQEGREVQILDTLEINFEEKSDGKIELSLVNLEKDLKLFKEAFPDYEFLGWYASGPKPSPQDSAIHQIMSRYNERPLYLMLDPRTDTKDLPIYIYEEETHATSSQFVQTSFKLQAEEAERITAAHCAKVYVAETKGPALNSNLSTVHKATKTLHDRVGVIQKYLQDVAAGKIPPDHKILRAIKGLSNRLPAMESEQFNQDFFSEFNDALLVTYLATITKGTETLDGVIEKFNVAHTPSLRGGIGASVLEMEAAPSDMMMFQQLAGWVRRH